jgi:pyrimidine-nucleoside phosphorylase
MNVVEIINKKRVNEELTKEELDFIFNGYLNGTVKDYQMSSLLMAICINGMSDREIFDLVDIFIKSGDVLDLSMLPGVKIDKHSTGGVGDKVTLIIGPIVAACGVVVPKMSGRGLGHTGGTIDKLESIPGFNVNLTEEEFINQVKNIGLAVTGQTKNLCPMDKVIYALRDVTGTVSSIPLIATSIMSKKIAGGADKILLDVKVGDGALMKEMDEAKKLADMMERIGMAYGKEVVCELTDMNTPLGDNIGNALEVIEAMDILKGKKSHLRDLCVEVSTKMVSMAKNISLEAAAKEVDEVLTSGKAYDKFLEFVKAQGGDINGVKVSDKTIDVKSTKSGTIKKIKALALGMLSVSLGAGRMSKEDAIDYSVGIVLKKHIGETVNVGDTLFTLYINKDIEVDPNNYYEIN